LGDYLSFEGAFISDFGVQHHLRTQRTVLPSFTSIKPQYPSGPWLTGISGVYHAVITLGTSTASKNLFFYQLPVLLPLLSASSFRSLIF
jgi:hypothetical protein